MISYTIYKHTFPNNKVYIGITSQTIHRRWQNGLGYRNQGIVYRAILKYGWDNIRHEILFTGLSKEEAEQKEIELIAQHKSNQKQYGYNIENGGNCVGKLSEETKEKIRLSSTGRKYSEETREKHRNLAIKQWQSGNLNNGKPCICIETQVIYPRIKDASIETGICDETIRRCCHNLRKTAGGFHWQFCNGGGLDDKGI